MHQERQITNSNEPRSVKAIALYPSGNAQHTWYFMSLNTGKRLHRRNWTPLPMGEEIITRVHALVEKKGRSRVTNNFNFEWRPGTVIKEPPSEGTSEDQSSVDEPMEESEDPGDEHTEQGGEPIEAGDPINEEEENEDEEPTGPAQSTDKARFCMKR